MSPAGVALIMLSCLWGARKMTEGQKKHLSALRSVSAALGRLRAELSLRLTSLPVLAEQFAQEEQGASGAFFAALHEGLLKLGEKSFHQLWSEAAEVALPELSAAERESFCRLGGTLGRYELGDQLAEIDLCRSAIDRAAAELAAELPNRRRIAYGMSCAAGALLSIVLIS